MKFYVVSLRANWKEAPVARALGQPGLQRQNHSRLRQQPADLTDEVLRNLKETRPPRNSKSAPPAVTQLASSRTRATARRACTNTSYSSPSPEESRQQDPPPRILCPIREYNFSSTLTSSFVFSWGVLQSAATFAPPLSFSSQDGEGSCNIWGRENQLGKKLVQLGTYFSSSPFSFLFPHISQSSYA